MTGQIIAAKRIGVAVTELMRIYARRGAVTTAVTNLPHNKHKEGLHGIRKNGKRSGNYSEEA